MWGLGQRPNCSTGDQFKEKSPQRRRQRSVPASNFALPQERPPKLLFPTSMLCRARWARPDCLSSKHSLSFSQAGDFAAAGATRGQWKQTNVCGRHLDPFAVASHVTWFLSLQGRQKGKQWFFTESWGKSSLGARLRTRKVRGRDASLPAPLLTASLGLVGRGTVGALPQTPQGTLSLDPARGNCPLTPFRD